MILPAVHIHLGAALPYWLADTIKQTRRFHTGPVVCVGPGEGQINPERYEHAPALRRLRDVSWLDRRYNWPLDSKTYPNGLWGLGLARLFVLAELMREQGWDAALQIENDVVIYFDPNASAEVLRGCFGDMCAAIPNSPVSGCSAALFYVGSLAMLDAICAEILDLLPMGERALCAILPSAMIHEMALLGIVQQRHPEWLSSFPVMPSNPARWPLIARFGGPRGRVLRRWLDRVFPRHASHPPPHGLSNHLAEFDALFDAAPFGQYLGGTPNGQPPGTTFTHQWLGRDLAAGRYSFSWQADERGRRIPQVTDRERGGMWRLNNLHAHSKRIADFV